MSIRFAGRALLCGAILGFASAVWQTSTAILDLMRARTPLEVSSLHRRSEETPSKLKARASLADDDLQDAEAARVEAFERFQRESTEFWRRSYEAQLGAAGERVARETEAAFEVAARVNASAEREAMHIAEAQLRVQYREAARIAARQAEAEGAAVARVASRQSAADTEATERIAKTQLKKDLHAAELVARQQTELTSRVAEQIAREQVQSDRLDATGRVAIGAAQTATSKRAPSSWDGQHEPVP